MLLFCWRRGTVQICRSTCGLLPKVERLQWVIQHAGRQDNVSERNNIALTHKIPKYAHHSFKPGAVITGVRPAAWLADRWLEGTINAKVGLWERCGVPAGLPWVSGLRPQTMVGFLVIIDVILVYWTIGLLDFWIVNIGMSMGVWCHRQQYLSGLEH